MRPPVVPSGALRNDLRRACVACALRLPASWGACPRCRLGTTTPREALEALGSAKGSLRVDRPVRDALIYVPAALMYVAAVGVALVLAGLVITDGLLQGALGVALVLMCLVAGFTTTVVLLAIPWAVWAALVAIVSWVAGRNHRRLLRPAAFPFAAPERVPASGWFERGRHRWKDRWKRVAAIAFVALMALELAAELFSRKPFGQQSTGDSVKLAGGAVLFQVVMLVVLAIPLSVVLQALVGLEAKLVRLVVVWRARRREQRLVEAGPVDLRGGTRGTVRGTAHPAGPSCVAPLSGQRCLGYRLVGRAGLALVDDAEMSELVVRTGSEEVRVRASSVALALPEPADTIRELTPDQAERVRPFLAARGLELSSDLELAESLLAEGDGVTVHGAAGSEPVAGADYRTSSTRRVLDDTDGRPVLVEA